MTLHEEAHPKAGQTVKLNPKTFGEKAELLLEDWWDQIDGRSWRKVIGNPACISYTLRIIDCELPLDDEVVYGKIGIFGHLVHVSEIVDG